MSLLRLLIIEDEQNLLRRILEYFRREDFLQTGIEYPYPNRGKNIIICSSAKGLGISSTARVGKKRKSFNL